MKRDIKRLYWYVTVVVCFMLAIPVLKPATGLEENNGQSWPGSAIARLRCKETSLGTIDPGAIRLRKVDLLSGRIGSEQFMLAVSPDAQRVAYVVKRDDKQCVIVNGRAGKLYDDIFSWPSFSPNGKQIIYVAKQSQKKLLVIDGDEVAGYEDFGPIKFSPDGSRLAYVGIRHGYQYVVLDGVEGKPYKEISQLTFSHDGKRLAYQANDAIVIDGVEQKFLGSMFGKPWVISPDGTRTAYRVWELDDDPSTQPDSCPVIDGVLIRKHKMRWELAFSPDSKHVCYEAEDADVKTRWIVLDGVEGRRYKYILSTPVFSPDSKRLAYVAGRDSQQIVVLDGAEEGDYKEVRDDSLVFSPDSKRFAYVASRGSKQWEVVINGSGGKIYDDIWTDGVVFSPDSKRFAYATNKDGKWFVISDTGQSKSYERIWPGTITFDANSRHLAWAANIDGKWIIVVDGIESREYDSLLPKARLIFDAPGYLRTVCFDNNEFFLVEINLDAPSS